MTKYVLGFAFNEEGTVVALIRKNKPAWQKGKYNGIGGKIESGETALEAIVREFEEETGQKITEWEEFATLKGEIFDVACFRTFNNKIYNCETTTEEEVILHRLKPKDDITIEHIELIDNLSFLIPLATSEYQPVYGYFKYN